MKKQITFIIVLLFAGLTALMAQTPNMINYQGVARDASGNPIANQSVRIRLKVHDGTANGLVQYMEVRKPTTNNGGLFNIQIGSAGALSTSGSFASINWGNGAKFLQVEMDPTGGNNFTNMGTQQMVSVPYAQYANTASSLKFPVSATDSLSNPMLYLYNKNQDALSVKSINGYAVTAFSSFNSAVQGVNSSQTQAAVNAYNYSTAPGVSGFSQNGNNSTGENPKEGDDD